MGERESKDQELRQQIERLRRRSAELESQLADGEQRRGSSNESAEWFRVIAKAMPVPSAITTLEGKILHANALFGPAFGYSSEEVLEMPMPRLWADPASRAKLLEQLVQTGHVDGAEVRFRKADGSLFWGLLSFHLVTVDGQRAVLGAFVDITERKRAEEFERIRRDLGIALSSTSNLSEALEELLDAAMQIEGIDCGGVYLVSQATGESDLRAYRNLSPESAAHVSHFGADAEEWRLISAGTPIYWSQGDRFPNKRELEAERLSTLAAIPLLHAGKLIAVVILASHSLKGIKGGLRASLEDLAYQAGGTIARVLAGEALRESEERFRVIADAVPVPFATVSYDEGRVIFANARFAPAYGYSAEEILHVPAAQLYADPDIRGRLLEEIERTGRVDSAEVQLRKADGSTFWALLSLRAITLNGQRAAMGAFVDISERKRAAEALRASEQRFRAIFDRAPLGIALTDSRTGRFVQANPRLCEILGRTPDELPGLDFRAVTHPDDLQADLDNMKRLMAGDIRMFSLEKRYRRPGGAVVWASLTVVPMWKEDEAPDYHIAMLEDITQRKQAEQALHDSEERYRTLVENVDLGISLIDADYNIVMTNAAIARRVGKRPEQLIGEKCYRAYEGRAERCEDCPDVQARRTGRPADMIRERRLEDGTRSAAHVMSFPVRDADGRTRNCVDVVEDVTERRRAERFRDIRRNLEIALGTVKDVAAASESVLDAVMQLECVDCGGVYVRDPASGGWRLDKHRGISPQYAEAVNRSSPAEPFSRTMAVEEPAFLDRAGIAQLSAAGIQEGIRATAIFPAFHDGQPIAGFVAASKCRDDFPEHVRTALREMGALYSAALVRVLTEAAVQREKERAQRYLDIVKTVIVALTPEGKVSLMNPAGCALLGYREQEVIGKDWFENFLPQRLREPVRGALRDLMAGKIEVVERYENEVLTRSGAERLLAWHNSVIRSDNGEITGALCAAEDITEQRRGAEALYRSEETLRSTLASMDDLVFALDIEGRFITLPQARKTGLPVPSDRIVGRHFREVLPADVATRLDEAIMDLRISGDVQQLDYDLELDGRTSHWSAKVSARHDRQGSFAGVTLVARDVTVHKQVEMAVFREKDRAQRYLDVVRTVVSALSPDGKATLINQAGCRLLGYSEPEILGKSWVEHFMPVRTREEFKKRFSEWMAGTAEPAAYHENLVLTRSGEERLIAWHNTLLRNSAGEITGTLSSAEDITEQRQAADALHRSEEALRSTLSSMDDLVFALDTEGRFLALPQHGKEKLLVPPDRFVGRHFREILPRALADRLQEVTAIVESSGQAQQMDYAMEVEGRVSHWSAKISARQDQSGGFAGVTIVARDVTDRKLAEEELRKFKTISDRSPHGHAVMDLEGTVLYANDAFANMHGWTPEELVGQHMSVFHTEEQMTRVRTLLAELRRKGRFFNEEVGHRRRDGTIFPTRMSAAVVPDDTGAPKFLSGMAVDITVEKKAEEEKTALAEQLRQSQKMEAVGTLAGGVAHDFNNLLTAISGYTELAKTTLPDRHPSLEPLAMVEESAHQARGVINALLTFTRKGVTEKGPVDLGRVVSKTIKLLRRLLPASVVIVHEPPSEETWIYADATQIQQVIMNLALNARDAMPSGGKLSLSVGRQDTVAPPAGQGTADKSHTAALIVKDTGEGMSEEVRAKLFEPFFTTKPRGKGTGLGMAVVLGIVEDHKGRIEVESEPGKGTRVTVLLPLCAPLRKAPVARPPQQTGTHAQTPIILLEGDEHVQSIFASVLWSRGYEAVTTARLAEALAAIRAQPRKASVIIIDSDYLNEDGLRQVQAMGSESERFLMIELTSRPAGQELAGLPADRVVLRKPFLLADFLAAVDEIRERSGSE